MRQTFKKLFEEKNLGEYEEKCFEEALKFTNEKNCPQVISVIYYNLCNKILKNMKVKTEINAPLYEMNPELKIYLVKETILEEKKLYPFDCSKCKKETLQSYKKLQIRRADEGVSTFAICSVCNHSNRVD